MAIESLTFDEIAEGKPTKAKGIEPISSDELFGVKVPVTEVPAEIDAKSKLDLPPNILDLALAKHPLTIEKLQEPSEEFTKEFDKHELGPIFSEGFKQSLDKSWKEVNETLGEFAKLTHNPVKFVKGVGELAFSIPGFLVGIPVATQRAAETAFNQIVLGQSFNLEDIYFEAAKGMQETMKTMQPGVEAVWGKSDEQRELVGAVAMVPLMGLSILGREIAEWKGFEDYPNIRGAARFAGDIGGMLALGAVYRGKGKVAVAGKVRDVAKKAEEIKTAEEVLEYVPEDATRRAKEKILEVEKRQLELEVEELKKKIDLDVEVKKDLRKKGKKVKEIKEEGIEVETIREERLKYAKEKAEWETVTEGEGIEVMARRKVKKGIEPLEGPPEIVEAKPGEIKEPKFPRYPDLEALAESKGLSLHSGMAKMYDKQGKPTDQWVGPIHHVFEGPFKKDGITSELFHSGSIKDVRKFLGDFKEPKIEVKKLEPEIKEPITYLDRQTGTSIPSLEGEKSPFFQSEKTATVFRDIYARKEEAISEDVEVFSQKLINDVNRWYHGDEAIDIAKTRNNLSELATRADEVRMNFINAADFNSWKETVSEAAVWARRIEPDRLKIERRRIEDIHKTELGPDDLLTFKDPSGATKSIKAFDYKEVEEKTGISFGYDGIGEVSRNTELGKVKYFGGIPQSPMIEEALLWMKNKMPRLWSVPESIQVLPGGILSGDSIGSYRKDFKTMNITYDPKHITVRGYVNTIAHELGHAFEERRIVTEGEGIFADNLGNKAMELFDKEYEDRLKIERRRDVGTKLYSGIPLDEAGKAILAGAKRAKSYVDYARGTKRFKPKEAAKALNKEFKRSFVDRSGNIRLELLDKLGDVGYRVIQKMYLTKGAYALSAEKLRQMKKEVYGGLSRREKQVADNLILYGRLIDILGYKLLKDFRIPIDPISGKQLTIADMAEYTEYFEFLEKIPPERARIIENRVKGYYEWMKKPLKDMLDAELISKEEYDNLVAHNYRKIKLVDIFDKSYVSKVGKKSRTIYDSGIEALAKGRDTDIYEPSSEIMALEVFNRAYGRILNNEANLSLLEVSRNDPKNPFVRSKIKGESIPSGWQRFFVYEKGERKSIYLSPDMAKEWVTSKPEITYRHGQFLRYASLSPILRTFATGINWGFALANLPRDVMHTYFAARHFDGKEWKSVYSPHLPIFLPQIGTDLARIFPDAITRGKHYQGYIKEGGGMEFLVHQGRIIARGRRLEGPLDKVQDVLGYFGETTEIMTRLAIRDRVIRNRARQRGVSVEEARKNKDITREATFAARDYMDFGQGGGTAKALDNALPYLNAAIQGTRGLWRTANDNPKLFAYKAVQIGTVVTLLYTAMRENAPETTEALQGSIDMQNNLCIPFGDVYGFKNEYGETVYPYWKIPLDPSQKFFKAFFEGATDKMLGYEVDIDRVTNNMAELSPVGTSSLPPTVSGGIGYLYNKDLWRNEDVWKRTKPFDWPRSKEEYIPGRTPEFYKDIGKVTGLSPERAGHAIEEVTTSGTMWSYLLGKGYERLTADVPKSQKEQHLAMILSRVPIAKRFIGVTHPSTKYRGKHREIEQKVDLEYFIQTRELDRLTEGYLFEKSIERKEVWKYIKTFKEKSVRDRLIKRYDFQVAMKNVPERSFWLMLQSMKTPAKAEAYYERWKRIKDSPEKMKQLSRESAKVKTAGGVFSSAFWDEFSKLRGGE